MTYFFAAEDILWVIVMQFSNMFLRPEYDIVN